ncbi:MAG: PBP1A family penicillin-binding protein, partial [Betaproteobacteria bacterium]|nr:PBP1A family penicillin-binding protein [Betaproteobacteria bacterium]
LRGPATRLAQHKPNARQVLAASLAFVLFLGILWQRCGVLGCPAVGQLSAYRPGGGSVLLDRDGRQFAILAPVEHAVVPLKELPKYVPQAFMAVEDKRFYQHSGIDYRRVFGSLLANVKAGSVAQGFSTITMQLARNVWPDRLPGAQRTLKRKLLEIRVAIEIERKFAKDEILELYLNNIYFGGGAYGIEAAARNYFGHSARHLSLDEAAVLAAMPKSPRSYDPRRNPEQSATRRNLVLEMMAAQGHIDAEKAQAARAARLAVRREPPPEREKPSFAPYFVEAVRRELEDRLGEDLYTEPLRIHTTLDRRAQEIAEQELSRQLRAVESGEYGRFRGRRYSSAPDPGGDPEYLQGAALLVQVQTGDILALVGGRDFRQSRFDRATRALRQPGSAFKPFVFAVALGDGYAPSQHIADTPLRMELPGGEVWEPKNFGGEFEGDVTLREALVRSKNVPAVRLAAAVGIPDVIRLARRAGIRSPIPDLPSAAIGTGNVTPLDLTAAYTAFAGMGEASTPRGVTRVEDADGNVVWDNDAEVRRVLDPAVAYLVTNLLADAVNKGTGAGVRRGGYSGPAAGKTGTTSGGADAWFVGYTPDVVGTVWMGFDNPKPILRDATGGRLAAPVWGRIMRRVTRNRAPSREWIAPKQIHRAAVDPSTGLVLAQGCRPEHGRAVRELFIAGTEPASACPRGTPEPAGPGLLAKLITWNEAQFKRARTWVASRFGNEKPVRERKARERYLGAPKLPARADVPAPALPADSRRLFGEEAVIPDMPPGSAETLGTSGVAQPDPGDRVPTPSDSSLVR